MRVAAGVLCATHRARFLRARTEAHAELHWLLACDTPLGRLNRMTQFKEKSGEPLAVAHPSLFASATRAPTCASQPFASFVARTNTAFATAKHSARKLIL